MFDFLSATTTPETKVIQLSKHEKFDPFDEGFLFLKIILKNLIKNHYWFILSKKHEICATSSVKI